MITRLEIIKRRFGASQAASQWRDSESMYVQGNIPNAPSRRLLLGFHDDKLRGTQWPADYYRETFLCNDHQT